MDISEINKYLINPALAVSYDVLSAEFEDKYEWGDPADQLQLAEALTAMLVQTGLSLQQSNAKLYDHYYAFAALLKFKAFVLCSEKEREDLLERKTLFAIQKGFDCDAIIRDYFDLYSEDYDYIAQLFRTYAKSLEQNIEKLGNIPLEVDGRKVMPEMKYWLIDYSKFPSLTAKRGAVERLNYLNSSANVRQLTQVQRKNLLDFLKLYDEFLNPQPLRGDREASSNNEFEIEDMQIPQDFSGLNMAEDEISAQPKVPAASEHGAADIDQKLNELKKRIKP